MERDRHVRDELAEIRHLLQISPSHSSGSRGERRSQHSPPHSREAGHLVEHRTRPSVKDRLEPPEEGRNRKDMGRKERSRSPCGRPSASERLGGRSVSASSTHSVRIGKGRPEPTNRRNPSVPHSCLGFLKPNP
ncbi:hypothetical protein RHGRI_026723 [Rhododendron griersonianum]|uniref:Uncharacterized protein n=1 Tax=Rhododendron griersonianum TaxID=479676 RepID=A0AAV6IYS7_9ERIC|nr:hypothetical protein RHGRI_026723 [Rhododendron griersonianum]